MHLFKVGGSSRYVHQHLLRTRTRFVPTTFGLKFGAAYSQKRLTWIRYTMNDALLGYSGVVGSHLRENLSPSETEYFNSTNIQDVVGRQFNTVYCACVPAVKWKAMANPEEDLCQIEALMETLASVKCRKFILISTVDVHSPDVLDQVEDNIDPSTETYGKNRYALEIFLREEFDDKLLIVRLPAIFGVGLKKNYLYDLMNCHQLGGINLNSRFQWYSLSWLWEDVNLAITAGNKIINLYSEAVETFEIVGRFFPQLESSLTHFGDRVSYSHSSRYGKRSSAEVYEAMSDYIGLEAMKRESAGIGNRLVVSNMAWKTEHDGHAAFLMERYGINNLEILPSKLAAWDEVFETNLKDSFDVFHRHGISVYSVQSILHGIRGKIGDRSVDEHLEKVVRFCERVGAKVVVMGSPGKRGKSCDRGVLADVLERIQSLSAEVKICLEPNSAVYKCSVGKNLGECSDVRGNRDFFLNYDTGNAYMENDRLPSFGDRIGHVQISNALLTPLQKIDYDRLVESGVRQSICSMLAKDRDLKVSLEVNMFDNIALLGEQIRRFSQFSRDSLV